MPEKAVLIYRSHMLRHAEHWIKAQADSMSAYTPLFAYSSPAQEIQLSSEQTIRLSIPDFWRPITPLSLRPACHFQYLIDWIAGREVKVLYAHFGPDAVEALPIAEALHVPLVAAFHGYDASLRDEVLREQGIFHRRFLFWRNELKETAALFVCDSDYIAEALVEKGFPRSKVRTHYVGTAVQSADEVAGVRRDPCVLFAGELLERTGCEYLMRAMRVVQRSLPLLRLIVAGEGALEPELRALAYHLSINVEFKGRVSHQEVVAMLRTSLMVCLPSVRAENGDCEGLPLGLLDAQAAGCPIVSTRHSGIPEAVRQGVTAELVEERNAEQLAQAILLVARSSERRESAAREGPRFMKEKFDIRERTRLLESLFDEVTSQTVAMQPA